MQKPTQGEHHGRLTTEMTQLPANECQRTANHPQEPGKGINTSPLSTQEEPTLGTPCRWSFSLQNCETMNFGGVIPRGQH